jgi:Flp pilus assembly protein TadG
MRTSVFFLSIANLVGRLRADDRGAVSVIMGVLMIPLVGVLALGFEVSNWYMTTRSMQNAADAAALAAATNFGSNYDVEAKAVAAQYGFVDGTNTISVTASNAAACPGGGNNCYSVSISGAVPLLLSQVVGFKGDTTSNGAAAKQLSSSAVAIHPNTPTDFCLVALGPQGIRANGAPKASMACNTMANAGSTCNGGNLGAPIGAAHNTNGGCGARQYSNVPAIVDPYAALAAKIPADPCGGFYPQEPGKKGGPALNTQWSGPMSLPNGDTKICGDLQLTGNVTINTTLGGPGAVLTIFNGQLDTNGYTISTSNGSGLTVVFSGDNSPSYTHAPTGSGTLDIAAPTTGPACPSSVPCSWKGVALYQDPKLTSGVDISAAGNTPAWDITGLVYLPNSSLTLSGIVNKAGFGQSCFAMVVKDITINGTGAILPNGQCIPAGLGMPQTTIPGRATLVL